MKYVGWFVFFNCTLLIATMNYNASEPEQVDELYECGSKKCFRVHCGFGSCFGLMGSILMTPLIMNDTAITFLHGTGAMVPLMTAVIIAPILIGPGISYLCSIGCTPPDERMVQSQHNTHLDTQITTSSYHHWIYRFPYFLGICSKNKKVEQGREQEYLLKEIKIEKR